MVGLGLNPRNAEGARTDFRVLFNMRQMGLSCVLEMSMSSSPHRKLRDMQGTVRVMLFLREGAELVELPLSSRHQAAIGHAGLVASRPAASVRNATRVDVSCRVDGSRMLPHLAMLALMFIAPA
jgi:hypothetical protein